MNIQLNTQGATSIMKPLTGKVSLLLAQQQNKRFATVEELGALTVFLASDAAAAITGVALPVDGGWTAH